MKQGLLDELARCRGAAEKENLISQWQLMSDAPGSQWLGKTHAAATVWQGHRNEGALLLCSFPGQSGNPTDLRIRIDLMDAQIIRKVVNVLWHRNGATAKYDKSFPTLLAPSFLLCEAMLRFPAVDSAWAVTSLTSLYRL